MACLEACNLQLVGTHQDSGLIQEKMLSVFFILLGVVVRLAAAVPPNLVEVFDPIYGTTGFYHQIVAPVDHSDPSGAQWNLTYFVNFEYFRPGGPIFLTNNYGTVDESYLGVNIRYTQGDTWTYFGLVEADFQELGALLINVPNRFFGCNAARAALPWGSCPVSTSDPTTTDDALERLEHLTLEQVVADIAFVARETRSTYSEEWGMEVDPETGLALNAAVTFGCSWPGSASTYARMLFPDVITGAVATSNPLTSDESGNPYYKNAQGVSYASSASGGSPECAAVLTAGHEEIYRLLEADGVELTNGNSNCPVQDCVVSPTVNRDFFFDDDYYYPYGFGIPGLPNTQNMPRPGECYRPGCNVAETCKFLLQCSHGGDTNEAYGCLVDFRRARVLSAAKSSDGAAAVVPPQQLALKRGGDMFRLDAERLRALNQRGRSRRTVGMRTGAATAAADYDVFQPGVLIDAMFGFRGPLWMAQSCDLNSSCPFVQGPLGGVSTDQLFSGYHDAYALSGVTLDEFVQGLRSGANAWLESMGGQTPWVAKPESTTNIYWIYNDADPWTATGVALPVPEGRELTYELAEGGFSHCRFESRGVRASIQKWIAGTKAGVKGVN